MKDEYTLTIQKGWLNRFKKCFRPREEVHVKIEKTSLNSSFGNIARGRGRVE